MLARSFIARVQRIQTAKWRATFSIAAATLRMYSSVMCSLRFTRMPVGEDRLRLGALVLVKSISVRPISLTGQRPAKKA